MHFFHFVKSKSLGGVNYKEELYINFLSSY